MVVGVVSIALGLLALAFFWWFPTATLVLGATAVAAASLGVDSKGDGG